MHHYKENGLLVEGSLNNLRQSCIQFPKPKKLINRNNPGTHFMNTNTYNAKEVLGGLNSYHAPANWASGGGRSNNQNVSILTEYL